MLKRIGWCALVGFTFTGCELELGETSAMGPRVAKPGGTIDANGSSATFVPARVDGPPPATVLRDSPSNTRYDTSLRFSITGPSIVNPGGCYPYALNLVDAMSMPTTAAETAYISTKFSGGGDVFFNAGCTNRISRMTIPEGGSQLNLYMRLHGTSTESIFANGDSYAVQGTSFTMLGASIIDDEVTHVAAMQDGSGRFYAVGHFKYFGPNKIPGIARFNPDGSLDTTFDPGEGFGEDTIESIYVYKDGTERILIGGDFTSYNGHPHNYIVRLNPDGSVDSTFQGSGFSWIVYDARVGIDGKIYAGGFFTLADGIPSRRLARLNPDGSFDPSFDVGGYSSLNSAVIKVHPLNDGSVIVGGYFTAYQNIDKPYFAKFNNDGSLDEDFPQTSNGAGTSFYPLAIHRDPTNSDKAYVGGLFTSYGADSVPYIVKIDVDTGARDSSFAPDGSFSQRTNAIGFADDGSNDVLFGGGHSFKRVQASDGSIVYGGTTNDNINDIAVLGLGTGQSVFGGEFDDVNNNTLGSGDIHNRYLTKIENNGQPSTTIGHIGDDNDQTIYGSLPLNDGSGDVLVFGDFIDLMSTTVDYVAKIQPDGSIDTSYTGSANDAILGIHRVGDKAYIYGRFTTYNGHSANRIARINMSDGSFDASFNPGTGANNVVHAVQSDAKGNLFIGGGFGLFNGTTARYLVKLLPDGSIDTDFMDGFGSGFSSSVYSIAIDHEDMLWAGGIFTSVNGEDSRFLVRLHANGTVAHAFDDAFNYIVQAILPTPEGKVYLGGLFQFHQNIYRPYLIRLNPNFSHDASFDPTEHIVAPVHTLQYHSTSGDFLVGTERGLVLMTEDAEVSTALHQHQTDGIVHDIALAADGSDDLFVTGGFTAADAQILGTWHIMRLKADGIFD